MAIYSICSSSNNRPGIIQNEPNHRLINLNLKVYDKDVVDEPLPSIPSLPISSQDAEHILRNLNHSIPTSWEGGLQSYGLGPGPVRVSFS